MKEVGLPYEVKPTRLAKKRKRIGVVPHVEVLRKGTGELMDSPGWIMEEVLVDASPFIKVYDPEVFRRLGYSSVKLLSYVMEAMTYEGLVTFMDTEAIRKSCGWSSNRSIELAVKELEAEDVIRRKEPCVYYVNPNVIGRGVRSVHNAE